MSHPQPAPLPTSRCFGLPTTDRTHHRSSNRQRRCDPIHASRRVSGALAPGRPELADFSRNARYSHAWCAPARAHFRTSTSISTAHRSSPSRSRRQRDLPGRSHARQQRRPAQGSERRTGPHTVRSHTVDTRDRVVGEPSRPRRARAASTPLGGFMSKRRSFEEVLDSEFRRIHGSARSVDYRRGLLQAQMPFSPKAQSTTTSTGYSRHWRHGPRVPNVLLEINGQPRQVPVEQVDGHAALERERGLPPRCPAISQSRVSDDWMR